MRYTKPQITNVADAHVLIQGSSDKGVFDVIDNDPQQQNCTTAAYEADE